MSKKVSPKTTRHVKTFEDAMYPLNLLNAVLGLTIFEVPCGRPWPKLSILYTLTRSLAYGAFLWYVDSYVPVKYSNIKIIPVVFQVILVVNIVMAAISTVLGLFNYRMSCGSIWRGPRNVVFPIRKNHIPWPPADRSTRHLCTKRLAKKMTLADETLEYFGIDPDYTSEHKRIVKRIILWSVSAAFILACDLAMNWIAFKDANEAITLTLIFDIPLLLNPMVEVNFSLSVQTLGKRFERLNALIQSVTDTPTASISPNDAHKYEKILNSNQKKVAVRPIFHQQNRNNLELLLKATRQLHLDLCGISRRVNDTCSKQMSMQMAATFILLTGFSYSLYLVYNEPNIPLMHKIQHYVSLAMWILISIFRMIQVVRISVNVTTEAQKTSQIAHEIQVPRSKNKLIDEIHQLSLQIMQHPLYFTASGLIVLDFGYVRGFVGSVTTYLMILIQNQPDMIKAANTLVEGTTDNSTMSTSTIKPT